jgi:CheY-like chemotaxis protein/HPt (histidine-containing phosphotransfer) domain-containing protein
LFDVLMRAATHATIRDVATRPYVPEILADDVNGELSSASSSARLNALSTSHVTSHVTTASATTQGQLPIDLDAAARDDINALDILVAEDNEVNQVVIRGMLAKRNHRVTVVANGQEAVDTALSKPHDLILMDIQMPVLDGIGAMQQIRRLFAARGNVSPPPIIAMTANALAGDREHYLAEGMDDYLAKPLRPVELQALIERVLPAARGAAKANVTKSSSDTSRTVAPAIALKAAPVSASVPTSVAPSSAPASTPSLASAINPSNDNAKDMPPILDLEQLEDMRGLPAGDDSEDSGANGLIELFRSKSEERMTAMEQALVQSDWMSLGDTAHSLRGAASSVGFPRVAAACKTLELASRRLAPKASMPVQATNAPLPTHADMDEMFDEIRLRFYEANQALTKWLQTV